jgi:hypothetical protein
VKREGGGADRAVLEEVVREQLEGDEREQYRARFQPPATAAGRSSMLVGGAPARVFGLLDIRVTSYYSLRHERTIRLERGTG